MSFIKFLFGSNRRISRVIRFSTRPRVVDETVSTHSYYVVLYSLIISKMLINRGVKVNVEKTMTRAILHDLDESVSGDIIRTFRERLSDELEKLCYEVMRGILQGLDKKIYEELLLNWSQKFNDIEGKIVNLCDNISGWAYSEEQIQMGNQIFISIANHYYERIIKQLNELKLTELESDFKKYDREKIAYAN